MLMGILKVVRLPPQCTFWRFLASLHLTVAAQLLKIQRVMRQRVWDAAHVKLGSVTLDTDTTVHTLRNARRRPVNDPSGSVFGDPMRYARSVGARKSYNPKNRGKKSYQPSKTRTTLRDPDISGRDTGVCGWRTA